MWGVDPSPTPRQADPYPFASSPQAWASGALFLMLLR
jgi:hypothetical protein